jgi:hypothetical protein
VQINTVEDFFKEFEHMMNLIQGLQWKIDNLERKVDRLPTTTTTMWPGGISPMPSMVPIGPTVPPTYPTTGAPTSTYDYTTAESIRNLKKYLEDNA